VSGIQGETGSESCLGTGFLGGRFVVLSHPRHFEGRCVFEAGSRFWGEGSILGAWGPQERTMLHSTLVSQKCVESA